MIAQTIKAFLLSFSVVFTIFSIEAWRTSDQAVSGVIVLAGILLRGSNIVEVIDKWHEERRRFELPTEEKLPYMWRRQAD